MNSRTFAKLTLRTTMILSVAVFSSRTTLARAQAITCGATLNGGYFRLEGDVECGAGTSAAITLTEGTVLDLNGYTVNCNQSAGDGIVITGTGNVLLHGTIKGCRHGVNVSGDHNQIVTVVSRNNTRRGFYVDAGEDNHFVNCVARKNGQHGFKIENGDDNQLLYSEALANCRDGIEIEAGDRNLVINNHAKGNGNEKTCGKFGEEYRPWFYAGIDILVNSFNNQVLNNESNRNSGCTLGAGQTSCEARERNLWDENVDENGTCISTNTWINNRADGEWITPECTPGP